MLCCRPQVSCMGVVCQLQHTKLKHEILFYGILVRYAYPMEFSHYMITLYPDCQQRLLDTTILTSTVSCSWFSTAICALHTREFVRLQQLLCVWVLFSCTLGGSHACSYTDVILHSRNFFEEFNFCNMQMLIALASINISAVYTTDHYGKWLGFGGCAGSEINN